MPQYPMRKRDFRMGVLRFVTHLDDASETLGGDMDTQGAFVGLADRAARGAKISLPVYAGPDDPDPTELGNRLRRQVRAALNNDRLRGQPLFIEADSDPGLRGWYMVGGGEVDYEPGASGFGEYKLSLSAMFRIGTTATHKQARRLTFTPRNVATNRIDYLGRWPGVAWANGQAAAWQTAVVPVRAEDLLTNSTLPILLNSPKWSKSGPLILTPMYSGARTNGEVVQFEQPETSIHSGDVAAYDRRGKANDDYYHPYGQRSTIPANIFINPFPRRDVAGYSAGAAGATLAWSAAGGPLHGNPSVAQGFAQTTCDGTVIGQGVLATASGPGVLKRNRTYRVSLRVKRTSGAGTLLLTATAGGGGYQQVSFTPDNTWNKIYTIDVTFAADLAANAFGLYVTTPTASAQVFGVAHLAIMDITDIPVAQRPTTALYNDGEQPGCSWGDRPDQGHTVCYGRANLFPNPLPTGEGGFFSSTGDMAYVLDKPRRTVQPHTMRLINNYSGVDPNGTYAQWLSYQYADPASFLPDQTFRMQGQRLAFSAYHFIDTPPDSRASVVAGFVDRLLYVTTPGSAVAASTMSLAVQGEWARIVLPVSSGSDSGGVPYANFGVFNNLGGSVPVYVTDFQMEFSLDGSASEPFSGYSRDSMFVGERSYNFYSVEDDPERSHGWERVLGPDQALTRGDIPVISNGFSRVRFVPTTHAFIVDSWKPTGGWQEQGRWTVWRDYAGARFQYQFLNAQESRYTSYGAAAIVELSQEHVVLKVTLAFPANRYLNRCDLYITLRRGWDAPRFEAYPYSSEGAAGCELLWAPAGNANHVCAGVANNAIWNSDIDTWSTLTATINAASASYEPWVALGRTQEEGATAGVARPGGYKVVTLALCQTNMAVYGRDDATAYGGSARHCLGVNANGGVTYGGYLSVQMGFTEMANSKASSGDSGAGIVYAGPTYIATGQGAKIFGSEVRETQTTEVTSAMYVSLGQVGYPRTGVYAVWARIRATVNAGTAKMYTDIASASVAVPVNAAFTWVKIGEVSFTSQTILLALNLIAGAGGADVRVTHLAMLPVQRQAATTEQDCADGIRDITNMVALCDGRAEPVLVARY